MIPCIIESPFKGRNKAEESRNKAYLDKCIRWCILQGFTPYASHKMLTNALDDDSPSEREEGIAAGLRMAETILHSNDQAVVIFFTDYGLSQGMVKYANPWYFARGFGARIQHEEIGKL